MARDDDGAIVSPATAAHRPQPIATSQNAIMKRSPRVHDLRELETEHADPERPADDFAATDTAYTKRHRASPSCSPTSVMYTTSLEALPEEPTDYTAAASACASMYTLDEEDHAALRQAFLARIALEAAIPMGAGTGAAAGAGPEPGWARAPATRPLRVPSPPWATTAAAAVSLVASADLAGARRAGAVLTRGW